MMNESTIGATGPLLHSVAAVQARLGLGRSKVYELLASGVLDAVKVGRRTLVTEASIARLVSGLPRAEFRAERRDFDQVSIEQTGGRHGRR